MNALTNETRPIIGRGFRLQWEAAQDAHVLLYPEGMVKLNSSAGEIMSRCDGERTLAEIVAAPAYGHKRVCASLPEGCTAVGSSNDLRQWLRRIAAECPRPLLAEVVRTDGDLLSLGLGRPAAS